jgi:hypothetical protein
MSGLEPERDLTDEQFVDLAVALVRVMFDPAPERQRLARIHGRRRPVEPGIVGKGRPRPPADGPPDMG